MPEVGDMAPDFELPSNLEKGKKVKLSDFRGKNNVVLAFYPLAWTPVWTGQMPAYEADLERFKGYDAQVLGISVDSVPCNTAWAKSLGGLSYDLLSDFEPKGEVARKFLAYRAKDGISERALFIVDKEGKIVFKDIHDISDQPDNEELFEVLRKL
jgi:peroxiredoxin